MKLKRSCLVLSLFTIGCVSVRDFKPREEKSGLYRAVSKKLYDASPEQVLRDADRKLVTTEADANRVLNATPSLSALGDNARANKCSVKTLYPAKVEQYRAEDAIRAKEYQKALDDLSVAERICPDIYLISPQEYLKAVALSGLGRGQAARVAAEKFLDYAAAVTPARYTQFDVAFASDLPQVFAADAEGLLKYRLRARAFLAGQAPLTWDEPTRVPQFYVNNPFRPGGNRLGEWLVLPAFATTEVVGPSLGLIGYYGYGTRSIAAALVSTERSGTYQDLRMRQSIYESANRDLDVDVFVGGRTVKRLRVTAHEDTVFGPTKTDVHVEKTSFDPFVGGGATYRLQPHYGLSGQLSVTANQLAHRADFVHSLYGFYDLIPHLSLNAGWINSRPMASVSLAFMHLGYNFRDQEVELLWQNLLF